MGPKSLKSLEKRKEHKKDEPFEKTVKMMESDTDKLWSSTEVHQLYVENSGVKLHRRSLIEAISKHFGDNLLLLSSKGIATLLVFRTRASQLWNIVQDTDDNFPALKFVAKQIVTESKAVEFDTRHHTTTIDEGIARMDCGETLL